MYFLGSLFFIDIFMLYLTQMKISANDALFYAAVLMLLNVNMFAFFIYFNRKVLYILFFLYHALSLSMPVLTLIRKVKNSELIYEYFYDRNFQTQLDQEIIMQGVTFIFLSDLMLIIFLLIIPRIKPASINYYRVKSIKFENVQYVLLIILLISIGSKMWLYAIGRWVTGEASENLPPITNTVLEFSKFDSIVFLAIGYYRQHGKTTKFMTILYVVGLSISLYYAFLSQSKAKIIQIAFIIIYNKFFYATKKDLIITLIIASMSVSILFPMIKYTRKHRDMNAAQAALEFTTRTVSGDYSEKAKEEYNPLKDDKLRRTDYFSVICLEMRVYPKYVEEFNWMYTQNLTGLIPRFLWPDKPIMGMNTNEVGHELGLINPDDHGTSIGLSPFGEGYKLFGIYAIFITPLLMAIIIKIAAEIFDDKLLFGRVFHYYLGLIIAQTDSYIVIVPALLKPVILVSLILIFINHVFPEEEKQVNKKG